MLGIIVLAAITFVIVYIVYKLLNSPFKKAAVILINTAIGFGVLIITDLLSGFTGIKLGVNLFNSVIVGVLGVPGFGMLLMMRWMLY